VFRYSGAIPVGHERAHRRQTPQNQAQGKGKMENVADYVPLAKQGDANAFGVLYEHYSPLIYRFLRRRLDGSDEAVEDLTEDVFVKVYKKLDRYEERGLPFTAWLYRIAHNHLVDYLRAQPRTATCSFDNITGIAEPHTTSGYGRVLDRAALEPALATLTAEQREAVQLRFLEGLSVSDTAAQMDRSEDAVKKLQARALSNLRRSMTASVEIPASAQYAVA